MSRTVIIILGTIFLTTFVIADDMRWFTLVDLSKEEYEKRHYDSAIEYAERALSDVDQECGEYHTEAIKVINYIIGLYFKLDFVNEYVDYIKILLKRSLVVLQQKEQKYGKDSEELIPEISSIKGAYSVLGEYSKVVEWEKRLLELQLKYESEDTDKISLTYFGLISDMNKANIDPCVQEEMYLEWISYIEDHPSEDKFNICSANHQYGIFLEREERYSEAEDKYIQALKHARNDDKSRFSEMVYINQLAEYYINREQYSEAEKILNEALDIAKENPRYGFVGNPYTYLNLGILKQKTGHLEEAEDYFQQIRSELISRHKERDTLDIKEISILLSDLYIEMGRPLDARIYKAVADGIVWSEGKVKQLYK